MEKEEMLKLAAEIGRGVRDLLWDRTIIMQSGSVMACVERSELEKSGKSLEDYFFEVTENRNADASTRPADGATAG